jgi:DNA invertase Pin-like site-specific DNA recombinase
VGYANRPVQRGANARQDLRAQTAAIAAECKRQRLELVETVREHGPQRTGARTRPGLGRALQRVLDGEAQGLVVSELSRLGDSLSELGRVLDWLLRSDIRLIAAAPRLDTDEEAGKLTVRTIIELSHREHERLVERTRVGMQAARRKGPPAVADQPALRDRIVRMRAQGMTLQAIADRLNAEGVPTVRGGAKWRTSSVQTAAGYRRRSARTRQLDASRDEVTSLVAPPETG